MLDDEFGVQLTGCSTQNEGASGHTIDQSPPPKVGADQDGRADEAVPNLVPQQGVVSSEAEQVPGEGARAKPNLEEVPKDDALPERSAGDGEDDADTLGFTGSDLARDTAQDKKNLARLRQSSSEISKLLFVSVPTNPENL